MNATTETTTKHFQKVVEVLGKRNVGSKVESPYDYYRISHLGLKAIVIKNFRDYFNLPREDVANMLNISSPTLYRWIKANKELERNYSIQLFELTDIYLHGTEVFGSKEDFSKWLNLPNVALGGFEPQELLELPGGISKVRDLLGRIEHGVYS